MGRTLAALAVLFLLLRVVTVAAYRDTLYCYGLVSHQFSIAEAAYKGHGFTYDAVLTENASKEANRSGRHIPLEEWARLAGSGEYTAYPAADLPGLGYLIAATSRRFGDRLTTRYAMAIQVSVQLASLLLFAGCVASVFGPRVALLAGLVYVLGYPFIWPLASKPMRDVFLVGFYVCSRRRDRRVREKRRGPLLSRRRGCSSPPAPCCCGCGRTGTTSVSSCCPWSRSSAAAPFARGASSRQWWSSPPGSCSATRCGSSI